VQDRESKLKDQVAEYEGQIAQYKIQLQTRSTGAVTTPAKPVPVRANGNTPPSVRAPSPASTVGPSRSVTPAGAGQPGVYGSMHAPKQRYPATIERAAIANPGPGVIARPNFAHTPSFRVPSPTLSVVSAAPTLGADGWWE
jgi:hypothetical protein